MMRVPGMRTMVLVGVVFAFACGLMAARPVDAGGEAAVPPWPAWEALERPYLYVTADELPALRERLEREPFARQWERFIEYADRCLEMPPTPATQWLNHSRTSLGISGTTAFAYLVTGDRRYGERAKQELMHSLRAERWHGFMLSVGERSLAAALVYDWCNDLFTPEETEEILDGLERLAFEPYHRGIERNAWWVNRRTSNWCGVVHGGVGMAGLAFAAQYPRARRAAELAWTHLQRYMRNVTREDGGGHEGVMYWRYGVSYGMKYMSATARLVGDDGGLFRDYTDKLAGYWDIYLHAPDQRYANFNSMGENTFAGLYGEDERQLSGGPRASLAALFESWVDGGDPLLLWAADSGGHHYAYHGGEPFWFLWRRDAPPAGPKPELQRNVLFRGAGHAILSSPTVWFAMNGGWTAAHGHFAADLGTFILVADGDRFTCDYDSRFRATADRSTLLFDGRDQPKDVAGRFLRFGETGGFSYAACDLSAVNPEKPVLRWVRHAVLVDGAYIVLFDDVEMAGECDVEWRLQSRLPMAADEEARTAVVEGRNGVLHVAASWPPDAAVLARTRETIHRIEGEEGIDIQTLSIRPAEPGLDLRFVAVLYPMGHDEAPPRVEFDGEGTLTVVAGERRDTLVFERGEGGWMLAEVNGESAAAIPDGAERSLRRVQP